MSYQTGIGAKLGISGALQCKDRDGNVLKTIAFTGAIPLVRIGISAEQAQQLIEEVKNGSDDRQ